MKKAGRPKINTEQEVRSIIADQRRRYPNGLDKSERKRTDEPYISYLKRMWMTGKYTPHGIIALVYLNYDIMMTRRQINWHYGQLKRAGVQDVPDWRESNTDLGV